MTRRSSIRISSAFGLLALAVILVTPVTTAAAAVTKRVSVRSDGAQANDRSAEPVISGNGRIVAFWSDAGNLVPGDSNAAPDIFVHDRRTGKTTRVSVRSNGVQADAGSGDPSISGSGRWVAFWSDAGNLVPGDSNAAADIFVRDRRTGKTRRVSVRSNGVQANAGSDDPSISRNGRYVAFESVADNLVRGDTNAVKDSFVHDRRTGKTRRVSVRSNGVQGDAQSDDPSISADGRYVAFESYATNLVKGDTNGAQDIFVHDRRTGKTRRVSVRSNGVQGNRASRDPVISADGRFVVFESEAGNLVRGDTNGVRDIFVHDRGTGKTRRVSVRSNGVQANAASRTPFISADGRYVTFESEAGNLVRGDTNGAQDVFVHDRSTGKTRRLSVRPNGDGGNAASAHASISADGRRVAFHSAAGDLVKNDSNGEPDVFVRGPLH